MSGRFLGLRATQGLCSIGIAALVSFFPWIWPLGGCFQGKFGSAVGKFYGYVDTGAGCVHDLEPVLDAPR